MSTQRKAVWLGLLVLGLCLAPACKTFTVAPGSDPVVVYAEAASETALDVFDSFLSWERRNQAVVLASCPEVHAGADGIRENGKRWIDELNAAIRAYKRNRTPENRTALLVAHQFLEMALTEVRYWLAQGKESK